MLYKIQLPVQSTVYSVKYTSTSVSNTYLKDNSTTKLIKLNHFFFMDFTFSIKDDWERLYTIALVLRCLRSFAWY